MISTTIADLIQEELPFQLTDDQLIASRLLGEFVADPRTERAMILRGYAGTGKTSIVGALVRVLRKVNVTTILLAPTGRAAKVFCAHAGVPALTIHRAIYRQKTFMGEDTPFQLGFNKQKNTIFIVDEASMIASGNGSVQEGIFGSGQLLDDLIKYVYEGHGCKLLLVGDQAQLPPVGEDESPALMHYVLAGYGLAVTEANLTQVVRQDKESNILRNATNFRNIISEYQQGYGTEELPQVVPGNDLTICPGDELIEALYRAYHDQGTDGTIVVTRSNKRANIYNNGIRSRIFDREEEFCRGDLVMAVKNNYHWTEQLQRSIAEQIKGKDTPEAHEQAKELMRIPAFIANGDVAEVVRFRNRHQQFGFTFADATLCFPDYDNFELECRVMLDTLQSESPSLTSEEQHRLYEAVLEDYQDIKDKKKRMQALREDPYYNAIQLKYAYAVTCHKAQGGQWQEVFIDQGYVDNASVDISYLRWLYTAFTRSTLHLHLVNWPKEQTSTE